MANESVSARGDNDESLGLLHINVRLHVCVEEGCNYIHLLDLKVLMTCNDKDDSQRSALDNGGKQRSPIWLLHVSSSDHTCFKLGDGAVGVPFELEFPHAPDDAHVGLVGMRSHVPLEMWESISDFVACSH